MTHDDRWKKGLVFDHVDLRTGEIVAHCGSYQVNEFGDTESAWRDESGRSHDGAGGHIVPIDRVVTTPRRWEISVSTSGRVQLLERSGGRTTAELAEALPEFAEWLREHSGVWESESPMAVPSWLPERFVVIVTPAGLEVIPSATGTTFAMVRRHAPAIARQLEAGVGARKGAL